MCSSTSIRSARPEQVSATNAVSQGPIPTLEQMRSAAMGQLDQNDIGDKKAYVDLLAEKVGVCMLKLSLVRNARRFTRSRSKKAGMLAAAKSIVVGTTNLNNAADIAADARIRFPGAVAEQVDYVIERCVRANDGSRKLKNRVGSIMKAIASAYDDRTSEKGKNKVLRIAGNAIANTINEKLGGSSFAWPTGEEETNGYGDRVMDARHDIREALADQMDELSAAEQKELLQVLNADLSSISVAVTMGYNAGDMARLERISKK